MFILDVQIAIISFSGHITGSYGLVNVHAGTIVTAIIIVVTVIPTDAGLSTSKI